MLTKNSTPKRNGRPSQAQSIQALRHNTPQNHRNAETDTHTTRMIRIIVIIIITISRTVTMVG